MKKYHVFGQENNGLTFLGSFEQFSDCTYQALGAYCDRTYIMMIMEDGSLQQTHKFEIYYNAEKRRDGRWIECNL